MQKTLGGDRLGSGKKMKVELHNYERSTFNQSYIWRSSMAAGTLVPFLVEIGLPGTTFDIELELDLKTHPTIGPLFASYKAQLDVFLAPIRLYNAQMHNNELGIGRNMSQIKLPQIALVANPIEFDPPPSSLDNLQINPSCLLAYLGIRGIGTVDSDLDPEPASRLFNAVGILAYWETYKNYYANKQEEIGAVIHNDNVPVNTNITTVNLVRLTGTSALNKIPPGALQAIEMTPGSLIQVSYSAGTPNAADVYLVTTTQSIPFTELLQSITPLTVGIGFTGSVKTKYIGLFAQGYGLAGAFDIKYVKPKVVTFPLANIDTMRKKILQDADGQFTLNEADIEPYKWLYEHENNVPNALSTQEGLALKTYQSDIFNNWLKTENIEAISTATAVDTSAGNFQIDAFIISKKVWQMLNRINVSGGSYDDWIDAVYVHDRYKSQESPMYMGGLIKELVFQEVISNAEATPDKPLGTLAGRGVLAQKHKGGYVQIHVDEPAIVLGIISLTPRIDYSQGNAWHVQLKTMDDFHKPALDEIGFQELITEQMAYWDTTWNGLEWVTRSAGKQPAWINYMTAHNKTYGNFAIPDNEMFMTLNRRYELDVPDTGAGLIKDLTTYIDPSKFNFIFAETQLDAQNFWAQIGVNITARRKMSSKVMPNI